VLGQHAFLSARLVRLRVAGDPGYVQAAANALSRNTQDLAGLISQVYGADAGAAFVPIWEGHETAIVDYTRARVDNDAVGQRRAEAQLAGYPAQMGDYLQKLTAGALPSVATQSVLRRHIDNQLQLADDVVAGDITGSYTVQREDYGELFRLATAIAAGIARQGTGKVPADFDPPQRRLESALGELLGEHWELAVDLTRAAPGSGKTLDVVGQEVDTNTKDLGAAMQVLFGAPVAQRFLDLWASHLDALVAYAQAGDDNGQRQAALAQLGDFEKAMAQLLSMGTQGRLASPQLIDTFVMHDAMLRDQFDAAAQKDWPTAYSIDYDGYQHMFKVSTALAQAIGPQLAARVPVGGVHTGGGGLAP
jgi:hypothetical protein